MFGDRVECEEVKTIFVWKRICPSNRSPASSIPQASKISERSSDALGAIFTELPHED